VLSDEILLHGELKHMLDIKDGWTFYILLALFVGGIIFGNYRAGKHPSPRKELSKMGVSLVIMGATALLFFMSFPTSIYLSSVPENLATLDEAQKVLQRQHEDLQRLNKSIESASFALYLFMLFGLNFAVSSIWEFGKALVKAVEDNSAEGITNMGSKAKLDRLFNFDDEDNLNKKD
jgi:hypothetical protein